MVEDVISNQSHKKLDQYLILRDQKPTLSTGDETFTEIQTELFLKDKGLLGDGG